jgi:hypothetical protein
VSAGYILKIRRGGAIFANSARKPMSMNNLLGRVSSYQYSIAALSAEKLKAKTI